MYDPLFTLDAIWRSEDEADDKEGCNQSYCEAHSKARWIGNKDKRLARLAGRRYRGVWRHGVSA